MKNPKDNVISTYSFPQLPLFPLLHRGEVVDCRVLDDREEDKDEADPKVNVHRFNVRNPRHGGIDPSDDGGHGQHCGDAWRGETLRLVTTVVSFPGLGGSQF